MHSWDLTPQQAINLQQELRQQIITTDQFGPVRYIAGVDVGFEDRGNTTRAAVVVMACPELEVVASAIARQPTRLPYIPGLLSFREVPAVLEALEQLTQPPDLLLCDGQGSYEAFRHCLPSRPVDRLAQHWRGQETADRHTSRRHP